MSTSIVETKVEILPEITPIPLMQLATSFWAFKTLATAVDMDLFTHLSTSPMNAPETARWFNIEERPAEMLLTVAQVSACWIKIGRMADIATLHWPRHFWLAPHVTILVGS